MAAAQSHSLQYRGITVRFEKGDLSRRRDDAVAISCDLAMALNSQLCASFVQLAGQQFQTSAIREVARHPQLYQYPPVPVAIRVQGSGRLRTRNVILLPIGSNFVGLVPQVLTEMLNSAIQCGAQSLAFPTIGTGGFRLLDHYGFCQALYAALQAVQNFGNLNTLTLVTTNDYWTDQCYLEVNDLVTNGQQVNAVPAVQNNCAIFGNFFAANPPNMQQAVPPAVNQQNIPNAGIGQGARFLRNVPLQGFNPNFLQFFQNAFGLQAAPAAQNNPTTSTQAANGNNQAVPFSSAFTTFDKTMVRDLYNACVKERQQQKTGSSNAEEDDRLEACPVCLNDMLDDIDNYDEDANTTIVQTIQCLHKFHRFCLTEWFKNKSSCPVCSTPCMDIHGNQPIGGTMSCYDMHTDADGYPGVGHIYINYDFPSGIQTVSYLEGPSIQILESRYHGTNRTCYLPNNAEGRKVRDMLRIAFNRRLIFTVGTSVTTGRQNTVTWNGIHHKTSLRGGPTRFGYPDPTYIQRVTEELATYGITESLLD